MNEVFSQTYHVRWSDLDPNRHMRHSAYLDLCAATRLAYLEHLGFDDKMFMKIQMGPILFSETIQYRKEVLGGEQIRANIRLSGLSEDGRKWKMRHELIRVSDNEVAAVLDVYGAWFDLKQRKVTQPPAELMTKVDQIQKTDDFENL